MSNRIETTQGFTPVISFTVPNTTDLTESRNVYVTFAQGKKKITKTGSDVSVSAHQIDVYLSQEDTLSFAAADVTVQINLTFANGRRGGSKQVPIEWNPNLLLEVLE